MDEDAFDKIIKNKVGIYEDPAFDEAALEEFKKRMSATAHVLWYKQYRTEIIVIAALILFTLLNKYLIVSALSERNVTAIAPAPISTNFAKQSYLSSIDSLQELICKLKEVNTANNPYSYSKVPADHSGSIDLIASQDDALLDQSVPHKNILLGNKNSLPTSFINLLNKNDLLVTKEGNAYLVIHDVNDNALLASPFNTGTNRQTIICMPALEEVETLTGDIHEKNASAKVMNDLQKHYFHGLGINLAPHADMVFNAFDGSNVSLTPRAGITLDWVVAPHFSIETSFDYLATRFTATDSFEKLGVINSESEVFGSLQKAIFATQNLSLPVGVKYRKWVSSKNELTIRASFNPYYALQQKITCTYAFQSQLNNNYGSNNANTISFIDKTEAIKLQKMYGSTIGASIGFQHIMKPKTKTELSLFYEKSLGKIGPQKNTMQLFGLKASYWFTVK